MIIGDFDTRIATAQLSLLFDIEAIFKRRGRKVASYENLDELLFDLTPIDAFDKYYPVFHSSSFRRVVSLIANSQYGVTFETLQSGCSDLNQFQLTDILKKAVELELLYYQEPKYVRSNPVGFGPTFEWYVAAVCVEELSSIAYWGVKVEDLTGNYDVVLFRENQIGYIECKSGKLSNITKSHIENFLERERVLAPQFSVYLVDGISRDRLNKIVSYALEQKLEYEFEIPGVMNTGVTLEAEEYKNFVRLIPINAFFVSVHGSIASSLREIYEFLTLICDRSLPTENMAAKDKFRVTK
jgi:hypothetical protein